jgi:hypothetical protein
MNYKIGILMFGDPTRGGTINSEVKFLKSLYENNTECEFYILTVNPSITKRIIRDKEILYNFPHEIITIFNEGDMPKLNFLNAIITYPGHSNFFGGYLNDNIVKMYKIISKCTNELMMPVFIRINDSEIKVRDYRLMCEIRLKDKETSAFMKDPINVEKARNLVSWKSWNYNNIYWFANGSKNSCDWVKETMYNRENENYRCSTKENFEKNTIYVSDDILFLIRKNFEKYKIFENKFQHNEKFCYIGFFDTVNTARAKAFNTLFKDNIHSIPIKIFGKGTEILTKLKGKNNIEIEEGYIKGDSKEYFEFLNSHMAYIFIGKGQKESRYIGKTVYDAVVARIPIIVYKKCDEKHIIFSSDEYYFNNEEELYLIYNKLKNKDIREQWIKEQQEEIFNNLPISDFKFSNYCNNKETENFNIPGFYQELIIKSKSKTLF